MNDLGGWSGFEDWTDLEAVRARLTAGADPDAVLSWQDDTPLHRAAVDGSPEVVAELARVGDLEAESLLGTPMWAAVAAGRADTARALATAGVDPWAEVGDGWSAARLSTVVEGLPALFGAVLSSEDAAAVAESKRLIPLLAGVVEEGMSVVCIAGVDVEEAARRLGAEVLQARTAEDLGIDVDDFDAWSPFVHATSVPGGCVVVQPCGFTPTRPENLEKLSRGTHLYSLFANPNNGDQGDIARDGESVAGDLHPGGGVDFDFPETDFLLSHLYENATLAYCFAYANLHPTDTRSVTGPPDLWLRLP